MIDFDLLDAAIEDAARENSVIAHDQSVWLGVPDGTEHADVCGTAMCLAGFIAVRAGAAVPPAQRAEDGEWDYPDWAVDEATGAYTPGAMHVSEFAEKRAGLSEGQADALFSGGNTLDQLRQMIAYLREHPDAVTVDLFDATDRAW